MKIKTTHVGSLPRPRDMHTKYLKKQEVTDTDLRHYLTEILEKQILLGLNFINNGELPRLDYINSTVKRISGFLETGIAPLPKDLEELPEYSRRFSGRNGLITLNPRAPIKLPACSEQLSYIGEQSLREELDMMISVFDELKEKYPTTDSELFFTAPSPGTVALFLENKYYPNYETYLQKLGEVLKQEYEIINSYGVFLQIDCPDLAMGGHTKFKDLDDDKFIAVVETNIDELNKADILVYPNPNTGSFNIAFRDANVPQSGILQIYDITGNLVYKEPINILKNNTTITIVVSVFILLIDYKTSKLLIYHFHQISSTI